MHLKHLYKLPLRTMLCINTLNKALTHFSLLKEKKDNEIRVMLLKSVFFRPVIVTCYAPCNRSGWVFYHVHTFCTNLYIWRLIHSEQAYTKSLNNFFLISKGLISHGGFNSLVSSKKSYFITMDHECFFACSQSLSL